MKGQEYNKGELLELKVKIEKEIVEDLEVMSRTSGYSKDDLVLIALKRFRSHHCDYIKDLPKMG